MTAVQSTQGSDDPPRRSIKMKIALSICAVGFAAMTAGIGTYATFTDSDSGNASISSGTVDINLGAVGVDNRLNDYTTNFVPGDSMQKRVKVRNAGTETASTITLTTSASFSSILNTDTVNGLHIEIQRCNGSIGWTEHNSPAYTYTCDQASAGDDTGTRSTVLARRSVIGSNMALSSMQALALGGTDDLVVTIDLPTGSGNTFQNTSTTINYTFTATQRAAVSK